jgi:hypothetical protein
MAIDVIEVQRALTNPADGEELAAQARDNGRRR